MPGGIEAEGACHLTWVGLGEAAAVISALELARPELARRRVEHLPAKAQRTASEISTDIGETQVTVRQLPQPDRQNTIQCAARAADRSNPGGAGAPANTVHAVDGLLVDQVARVRSAHGRIKAVCWRASEVRQGANGIDEAARALRDEIRDAPAKIEDAIPARSLGSAGPE